MDVGQAATLLLLLNECY